VPAWSHSRMTARRSWSSIKAPARPLGRLTADGAEQTKIDGVASSCGADERMTMASRRFTFLIDTNVFVRLEPFGSTPAHEPFDEAARFARRVHEHGHRLVIHEATRDDLLRDQDAERREFRC